MPRIPTLFTCDPNKMPFEFSDILASISPRSIFVSAPTEDDNFPIHGVKECMRDAKLTLSSFGEKNQSVKWLEAVHPECGHEFPKKEQVMAYEFIESSMYEASRIDE